MPWIIDVVDFRTVSLSDLQDIFFQPPPCQQADGARRRTFSPCTLISAVLTQRLGVSAPHRVAGINSRLGSFAPFRITGVGGRVPPH